jgi:hypothetical protein
MGYKEERVPCLRLVAEVAADPAPEQEFLGSSRPKEPSHVPTMASLLAKAKAAKQAHLHRAKEARQRRLDAHKRRAQGLRAKETQLHATIEAQQYEPMVMGWSPKQNTPKNKSQRSSKISHWSSKIWANGDGVKPKAKQKKTPPKTHFFFQSYISPVVVTLFTFWGFSYICLLICFHIY